MANIKFTEGSGLNDSIFGKSQAPIRALIEKKAQAYEAESALDSLFAMEKSKNWGEKFASVTSMHGFKPVGEDGLYPIDGMQEGYSKTLVHTTWKNRFTISREMADDAKTIDFKKEPQQFTQSFYLTRERFGAALYGAAITGKTEMRFEGTKFDVSSADGSALFAKDHGSRVKGVAKQSNQFSDAFSNDALMAAESAMQGFRDEGDNILTVSPDTILIPNDYKLKKEVFAAIGADRDPATANNGFNYTFGRWNVIVWQYLNQFITAGTSPWILLDSSYNKENYGAIWLDRTALEIKSRIDDNNDANVWSGYARFTGGFNDWRFAAVGGISGGTALIG